MKMTSYFSCYELEPIPTCSQEAEKCVKIFSLVWKKTSRSDPWRGMQAVSIKISYWVHLWEKWGSDKERVLGDSQKKKWTDFFQES